MSRGCAAHAPDSANRLGADDPSARMSVIVGGAAKSFKSCPSGGLPRPTTPIVAAEGLHVRRPIYAARSLEKPAVAADGKCVMTGKASARIPA